MKWWGGERKRSRESWENPTAKRPERSSPINCKFTNVETFSTWNIAQFLVLLKPARVCCFHWNVFLPRKFKSRLAQLSSNNESAAHNQFDAAIKSQFASEFYSELFLISAWISSSYWWIEQYLQETILISNHYFNSVENQPIISFI